MTIARRLRTMNAGHALVPKSEDDALVTFTCIQLMKNGEKMCLLPHHPEPPRKLYFTNNEKVTNANADSNEIEAIETSAETIKYNL